MDQEAEQAIRDGFDDLAGQGRPANAATVPEAARKRLEDGRQPERIYNAIQDMRAAGRLLAPDDPMDPGADWSLPDT